MSRRASNAVVLAVLVGCALLTAVWLVSAHFTREAEWRERETWRQLREER